MSKDIAIVKIDEYPVLHADAADVGTALQEALGAGTLNPISDLDRVHIPAGGGVAWEIPTLDGVDSAKSIEGVIVHHQDARSYWAQGMDETGGGTPPDCASADGVNGLGEPGGPCSACPLAAFGSDGRGQACKQIKVLYILTKDSMLPLVVTLPPTSLKATKQYLLRLAGRGIRASSVVTKISLDQEKNPDGIKYSVAKFEVAGKLSDKQQKAVADYTEGLKPAIAQAA